MGIQCFFLEDTGHRLTEYLPGGSAINKPLLVCQDTGERVFWEDAGFGAMAYLDWDPGYSGPDGKVLMVKVPATKDKDPRFFATWVIDAPIPGGNLFWHRSGRPPVVTVTPFVWINKPAGWRGRLTKGELVDS